MPDPTSSDLSWLQLLHDGAPRSSLEARQLADAREGSAPEMLRAGEMTLQIHDRLAELARQGRELSALNTVGRRLASVQGMDSVLREVVAQSRQLLGVDVTYLMLREPDGDLLRIEVVDGSRGSVLRGIQLAPGEGLGGECYAPANHSGWSRTSTPRTTWREPDRLLEIQLAFRMRDLVTRMVAGPPPACRTAAWSTRRSRGR